MVLGGLGSISGSVFSAVILTWLLERLRDVQQYRMVGYALLLAECALYALAYGWLALRPV